MAEKPERALRIVQVGMGTWGRDWARLVIPEVREVELVGCVDSDARALELSRHQFGVAPQQCFSSLDQALQTQPDAVLITTTLPGHAPVAKAALEAGLHVLVEKPFANTLESASELVRMAAAKRLTLMVSQNYRFFPAVRVAARLVKEAPLGPMHQISIDFRRNDPAPPNPMRRHHFDEQPLLVDMSIHHFDLLRLVLDREPETIDCNVWNPAWSGFQGPPAAVATILFDDDVVVSYRASWISGGPITPWAGEWRMDFEGGEIFWVSRGDDNVLNDRVVMRPRRGRPKAVLLPAMTRIDRAGTLNEFASAISDGREPETSGRDNLNTLAMTTAAVESADRGEAVQVPRPGAQLAV